MPDDIQALGATLQQLRDAADLSQPRVVDLVQRAGGDINQPRLSRIEAGRVLPTPEQASALLDVYGTAGSARGEILARVAELSARHADSRSGTAVLQHGDPAKLRARVRDMQRESRTVRCYQPAVLLGMLRPTGGNDPAGTGGGTAGEAAVIESMSSPADLYDPDRPDREWWLIQTEGALRAPVGSHVEHAALMDHIAELSYRPHVHFGVVPLDVLADVHGPVTGFRLYDERAALVRTDTGTALIMDPEQVATYVDWWGRVEARTVFEDEARAVLARIATRYRSRG